MGRIRTLVFDKKNKKGEDIEISAFLTSTIAWGNRKSIIKNARYLMDLMHNDPFNFVMYHKESDLLMLKPFVHRTFNDTDLTYFIKALKNIYTRHGGLEGVFSQHTTGSIFINIVLKL